MTKVFVPQVVTRYDHETNRVIQVFDLSAAATFGELTPILDSNDNPLFLSHLMPKIRKSLEDFSEHDYLLAIGDPTVIAACAAIISRRCPKINMLKWDKKMQHYIQMEIKL